MLLHRITRDRQNWRWCCGFLQNRKWSLTFILKSVSWGSLNIPLIPTEDLISGKCSILFLPPSLVLPFSGCWMILLHAVHHPTLPCFPRSLNCWLCPLQISPCLIMPSWLLAHYLDCSLDGYSTCSTTMYTCGNLERNWWGGRGDWGQESWGSLKHVVIKCKRCMEGWDPSYSLMLTNPNKNKVAFTLISSGSSSCASKFTIDFHETLD